MLESMLELTGVIAAAHFKNCVTADLMESHGPLDQATFQNLGRFAYDHMRMTQGMVDVFAMFKPTCCSMDWTPLQGWVVHGKTRSVCGWASMVCLIENEKASLNDVLGKLREIAHHM